MKERRNSHEKGLKIILLGNSGVGKTSLCNRWVKGNFDTSVPQTIGTSNSIKDVITDNGVLTISLWDTAGQEQYKSITPLYSRGAHAGIIVAAIDDMNSFQSLTSWLELLNSSSEHQIPAILAVNKIDVFSKIDEELAETVDLYKTHFNSLCYVSAATGEGVETLFREAAIIANDNDINSRTATVTLKEKKSDRSCC